MTTERELLIEGLHLAEDQLEVMWSRAWHRRYRAWVWKVREALDVDIGGTDPLGVDPKNETRKEDDADTGAEQLSDGVLHHAGPSEVPGADSQRDARNGGVRL